MSDSAELAAHGDEVLDWREWGAWYGVMGILNNEENSLANGTGDDYYVYELPGSGRFVLIPWDLDTLYRTPDEPLFIPVVEGSLSSIIRLLKWAPVTRLYCATMVEELKTHGRPDVMIDRLSAVKAYYAWLAERGLILIDIARKVKLPSVPKGPVRKDYLTLQEAIAVLQTQAKRCERYKKGSYRWAREFRDLTVLAMMLASCSWWRALSTLCSILSALSRLERCSDFSILTVPTSVGCRRCWHSLINFRRATSLSPAVR